MGKRNFNGGTNRREELFAERIGWRAEFGIDYSSERNIDYTFPSSHVILKESFYVLETLSSA